MAKKQKQLQDGPRKPIISGVMGQLEVFSIYRGIYSYGTPIGRVISPPSSPFIYDQVRMSTDRTESKEPPIDSRA